MNRSIYLILAIIFVQSINCDCPVRRAAQEGTQSLSDACNNKDLIRSNFIFILFVGFVIRLNLTLFLNFLSTVLDFSFRANLAAVLVSLILLGRQTLLYMIVFLPNGSSYTLTVGLAPCETSNSYYVTDIKAYFKEPNSNNPALIKTQFSATKVNIDTDNGLLYMSIGEFVFVSNSYDALWGVKTYDEMNSLFNPSITSLSEISNLNNLECISEDSCIVDRFTSITKPLVTFEFYMSLTYGISFRTLINYIYNSLFPNSFGFQLPIGSTILNCGC